MPPLRLSLHKSKSQLVRSRGTHLQPGARQRALFDGANVPSIEVAGAAGEIEHMGHPAQQDEFKRLSDGADGALIASSA